MIKKNKKTAFTLVELLVVIAIIGILSTLAVISLQNARSKARDAKRVADIRQIQTALELYYNSEGEYPSNLQVGTPIQSSGGTIYMAKFPQAPNITEGSCSNSDYSYEQKNNGSSYEISFCLSSKIGDLEAGDNIASPGGTTPPPPFVCGNNFTDSRDGKEYSTIEIGTQCWMKENLAYLPLVHDNNTFTSRGNAEEPAYGVYNYNGSDVNTAKSQSNYSTYGVLYNWYAAMTACPAGWRLPSGEDPSYPDSSNYDYNILIDFLGGDYSVVGGKLKATGTTYWKNLNTGATNNSGFTALPAGARKNDNGSFINLLYNAYFWSATLPSSGSSLIRFYGLNTNKSDLDNSHGSRADGYSVRCLLSNP